MMMVVRRDEACHTQAPDAADDTDLHFVCFVQRANAVYMLDGRREAPVLVRKNAQSSSLLEVTTTPLLPAMGDGT